MTIKLTRLELEIIEYFWRFEEATVREVFEAIPEESRPAFTTVQTIAQRLEQKGALVRSGKTGNALVFKPAITKPSVYRKMIDDLLDLFGGSAHPLVSHLVDSGKISLEDLKELESRAAARPRKRGKS
jgi:predicted transcriptional regulator